MEGADPRHARSLRDALLSGLCYIMDVVERRRASRPVLEIKGKKKKKNTVDGIVMKMLLDALMKNNLCKQHATLLGQAFKRVPVCHVNHNGHSVR